AALLAGLLAGGRSWWTRIDAAHHRQLFAPYLLVTTLEADGPQRGLRLRIGDPRWGRQDWTPLVPDHGKLMHLFLVRTAGRDAVAHPHPGPDMERRGQAWQPARAAARPPAGQGVAPGAADGFRAALPRLPAGLYRVYADITQESGFAETMTA